MNELAQTRGECYLTLLLAIARNASFCGDLAGALYCVASHEMLLPSARFPVLREVSFYSTFDKLGDRGIELRNSEAS